MKFIQENSISNQVFQPHWPESVSQGRVYNLDLTEFGDDERNLRIFFNEDGDAYLSLKERQLGNPPETHPSICVRSVRGGGQHLRTRQALLWLAEAIRLDNEELGINLPCCPNETRNLNGGCDNCGDPCL